MKLLSIIFFIAAVLSAVISVLAFLGKVSEKPKETGIVFAVASGIFGFCELICVWNSPKGLILVVAGVLLVNLIFTISKNEGENES